MNPYNISIPLATPDMAMNAGRIIGLNHALSIASSVEDLEVLERADIAARKFKDAARDLAVQHGLFGDKDAATDISLITAFNAGPPTRDNESIIQWWEKWAPMMTLFEMSMRLKDFVEAHRGEDQHQADPIQSLVRVTASEIELIPNAYPARMFLAGAQTDTPPLFVAPDDPRIPRGGFVVEGATRVFIAANADLTEGDDEDDEPYVMSGDGRECLALLAGRPQQELTQIGRLCMAYDVMQLYGSFLERHPEREVVANVFINVTHMQQHRAEKLEGQGIRLNYDAPNVPPTDADEVTCFNIGQHDFLVQEMRLIKKAKEDNRMVRLAMKFHERLSNEINTALTSLKDAERFPLDIWSPGRKQLRRPIEETQAHVIGGALVHGTPVPALVRLTVRLSKVSSNVENVMAESGLEP